MDKIKKELFILVGRLMLEDRNTMAPETLAIVEKYEGEAAEYFCRQAMRRK